jgi:hypothetical protein
MATNNKMSNILLGISVVLEGISQIPVLTFEPVINDWYKQNNKRLNHPFLRDLPERFDTNYVELSNNVKAFRGSIVKRPLQRWKQKLENHYAVPLGSYKGEGFVVEMVDDRYMRIGTMQQFRAGYQLEKVQIHRTPQPDITLDLLLERAKEKDETYSLTERNCKRVAFYIATGIQCPPIALPLRQVQLGLTEISIGLNRAIRLSNKGLYGSDNGIKLREEIQKGLIKAEIERLGKA